MVVDALDECPVETDTKANVLCALRKLPNLHLLVTSRPHVDINSEFNSLVQLDIRAANRDMEVFIRGRLDEHRNLKRYVDEDFKEALVDKIVNKSEGMCVQLSISLLTARFLLAHLHLEMLSRQRTRNAVRDASEKLPSGLDDTYDDVMDRIYKQSKEDVDLALKVLSWITYAKEPLKAKALQHAVAIKPDMKTLDDGDLTDIDDLISLCAGIVTIDPQSGIVRLVHYTTQGYLEKKLMDRKVDIARGCLIYLGLEEFREPCDWQGGEEGLENHLDDRMMKYPFVHYAAVYWSDHIRRNLEEELKDICLSVFQWKGLRDSISQIEQYLRRPWELSPCGIEHSLLHTLASAGLNMLCRLLLDKQFEGFHMYIDEISQS